MQGNLTLTSIPNSSPAQTQDVLELHEKTYEPKQVKVTISEKSVRNLDKACEAQGLSRAQIIEQSLNDYLNRSFNWQTRRYFLEKSEKTFNISDLQNITSKTRVFVVCTNDKDSSYREWMCAYITSVNKDGTITIQPSHLVNPFDAAHNLNIDEENDLVIPKIVDWNSTLQPAPYWQNYRFTIDIKYIWHITKELF